MNWNEIIGEALGYENVTEIDKVQPSFGSPWAEAYPMLVVFGCIGLVALSLFFYVRLQERGPLGMRIALGLVRGLILSLLLVIVADPILQLTFTSHPKPLLWLLVDGTDSMGIADEYSPERQQQLVEAVDLKEEPVGNNSAETQKPSRMDYVRAMFDQEQDNLLEQLQEKYRLRVYLFDGPDNVKPIELTGEDTAPDMVLDRELVRAQLTSSGGVTAIGNAFEDLARRHATGNLSGVLVISDFAYNAGTAPNAAAKKLNVPVSTVGLGSKSARDLAVDLLTPPKMKKDEQSIIQVTITHQEFDQEQVTVRVIALPAGMEETPGQMLEIGSQEIRLEQPTVTTDFPFTPKEAGRYIFQVEIGQRDGTTNELGLPMLKPLQSEVVEQNNRSEREVTIIDDFMRLQYVAYEPNWEWRFVKEVFYRDNLVGLRGFRTFLRSADRKVKEENELFLPSLTQPRKEFFKNDVIFLGDMPAAALSPTFCKMLKEFVSQFGGGLVVMAGPQFGPGELADTPLADMLPVIVDPDGMVQANQEFPLVLTPQAEGYDFMNLGGNPEENAKAWNNLGRLPWYQPVKRLEPGASTILAAHPTDKCADGKTPQPLIAIRKYGRGEVVYVAFDEMWRLRKKYGETYYRQFWGQLIYRLGLSHALGNQKRFVVRTDRQKYRSDERVIFTVEAYNEDYEPLTADALPDKFLKGELTRPPGQSQPGGAVEEIKISELRPGLFEARVPVFEGGEYRMKVYDPIEEQFSDSVHFQVSQESVERRVATRNTAVQTNIAYDTGGKTYELDTMRQYLDDFDPPRLSESSVEIFSLWDTWLTFGLFILLALGEWFTRKLINLA